ncbi:MAG TPA: exosortase-associated EpsI family protein [Isosphaeraceae bacterium]|jgi:hypothetical protein|nr:exosortase-associated EpsI family protein [Isosphaeraceae bacterium]
MSTTELTTTPAAAPAAAAGGRRGTPWGRVALACALLLGSAAVRFWQARRVDREIVAGRMPPFPLKELPLELGPWKGTDGELEPEIASGAGCTGNIARVYEDERTGLKLRIIVLYGPAASVYIHSPEVCYPRAGYGLELGPIGRAIELPTPADKARRAEFASLLFSKGEGGLADRETVYYAWWYKGTWSPRQLNQKQSERIPGMFKVHVERRAGPYERLRLEGADPPGLGEEPCESFLKILLPEIERRIAAAGGGARPVAAATPPEATR